MGQNLAGPPETMMATLVTGNPSEVEVIVGFEVRRTIAMGDAHELVLLRFSSKETNHEGLPSERSVRQ